MNAEQPIDNRARTILNERDRTVLRLIPEGNFTMGSTQEQIEKAVQMDADGPQFALRNETPQFIVFVPSFYISLYAVTNEQFARFLSETRPSPGLMSQWIPWLDRIESVKPGERRFRAQAGFERHPVVNVSWFGADSYCQWAKLRLPTEIEWEKAARGIDGRIFPWGNTWNPENLCWWGSHGGGATTSPVDSFREGCSPYGLFSMSGNVEEWCADWYLPDVYRKYAEGDFEAPGHGRGRVIRGGNCLRRNKLEFRCARRRGTQSIFTNILLTGFRCACDPLP